MEISVGLAIPAQEEEKVKELDRMIQVIRTAEQMISRSAASEDPANAYWISGGKHEPSIDYCYEHALEKVNEKHDDTNNDYDAFVDGGWPTAHDSEPFCAECGRRLDFSPTDHFIDSEINHFLTYWSDHISGSEAYELETVFSYVQTNPLRFKLTKDDDSIRESIRRIEGAYTLAERVISAVIFCTSNRSSGQAWP